MSTPLKYLQHLFSHYSHLALGSAIGAIPAILASQNAADSSGGIAAVGLTNFLTGTIGSLYASWIDRSRTSSPEQLQTDIVCNSTIQIIRNLFDTPAYSQNDDFRVLGQLADKLRDDWQILKNTPSFRDTVVSLEKTNPTDWIRADNADTTTVACETANWSRLLTAVCDQHSLKITPEVLTLVATELTQHLAHEIATAYTSTNTHFQEAHLSILVHLVEESKQLSLSSADMSSTLTQLLSLLNSRLPPIAAAVAPTAEEQLTAATALSSRAQFEEAARMAEDAARIATRSGTNKIAWEAHLHAARYWCQHAIATVRSGTSRQQSANFATSNICSAKTMGAPLAKLALESALLAASTGDVEAAIAETSIVLTDATSSETDRIEAQSLQLQAYINGRRLNEALSCEKTVMTLRQQAAGEQLLLLDAAWLRTLLEADKATDVDVAAGIDRFENMVSETPETRYRILKTVVRSASREKARDPFVGTARQISILKSCYRIMEPTADAAELADIASRIAALVALAGDEHETSDFIGHTDYWVERAKDADSSNGADARWLALKAGASLAKARTAYRLATALSSTRNAERWLSCAREATDDVFGVVERSRDRIGADASLILSEAMYWRGEIQAQLGNLNEAAACFQRVRSPSAMANRGFRDQVAMSAWLREAEVLCDSGNVDDAQATLTDIKSHPAAAQHIVAGADSLGRYIEETVLPVRSWFQSDHGLRIAEMAKRRGLREAVQMQCKYLVQWYSEFYSGSHSFYSRMSSANMSTCYDFWGRGGFARVAAAIRAKPYRAIAVDAKSVEDIRRGAKVLCHYFDTVVVKWKGPLECPEALVNVFPDPAPDSDEYGDFFGGHGFIRCMGDRSSNTTVLMGSATLLPQSVGEFLAVEALPLVASGRLVVFPAPLVGCTQRAIGWCDDLLTRLFLGGVMEASHVSTSHATAKGQLDLCNVALPFIDGIGLSDLAKVLDELEDSSMSARDLASEVSGGLGNEEFTRITSLERDFRDACRELEGKMRRIRSGDGGANWNIDAMIGTATATAPGSTSIGSDANTSLLRAIGRDQKHLAPWISLFALQGLGGYLDWSCALDNCARRPTPTQYGEIRHSWIYPGFGGPWAAGSPIENDPA
jgi:hypothetical protein